MNHVERISGLLDEWSSVRTIKPRHDAFKWQSERDWLDRHAQNLHQHFLFDEDESGVMHAMRQFEEKLENYKNSIIHDVLKYGSR